MQRLEVSVLYRITPKTETFEMRSGSNVQLAALRNRNLELQTISPFSNHGSVERSTTCCHHKNVLHVWIFQKFLFFWVTLYIYMSLGGKGLIVEYNIC
jgi:hypothetical protein